MQATTAFEKLLTQKLSSIHKSRLEAVFFGIRSIVSANTLALPKVARHSPGPTTPKNHYKRLNRLINNPRLYQDLALFGQFLLEHFTPGGLQPVVLIDWTDIGEDFHALCAAIALDGRSLPIVTKVYPASMQNSPQAHTELLEHLKAILPDGLVPILVTDGIFQGPWFRAVRQLGWDFVGRVTHENVIVTCEKTGRRDKIRDVIEWAKSTVSDLGQIGLFGAERRVPGRGVLGKKYKPRPGHKSRKRTNKDRGMSRAYARKRYAKAWVLFTSLTEPSANAIDRIYALRMRIEELFRDAKNPRFGWSLRYLNLKGTQRYEVLLMLAALAMLVVMAAGRAGELHGFARQYQSNTISTRRVLSIFVLGQAVIMRGDMRRLTTSMWRKGWQNLVDQADACFALACSKSGET